MTKKEQQQTFCKLLTWFKVTSNWNGLRTEWAGGFSQGGRVAACQAPLYIKREKVWLVARQRDTPQEIQFAIVSETDTRRNTGLKCVWDTQYITRITDTFNDYYQGSSQTLPALGGGFSFRRIILPCRENIHNLCVSMVYLWYWLPANTGFDCLSDSDIKKKKTYIGFIISYFFKLKTLNPQYYF